MLKVCQKKRKVSRLLIFKTIKRTKKNNKRKTPYHFEMDYAIMKNNIIER